MDRRLQKIEQTLLKTGLGATAVRAARQRLNRPSGRWAPPMLDPTNTGENGDLITYWRGRLASHNGADTYAGAVIEKFPEDLRVYEHLLWTGRANVVIELGSHNGGSTLWFRDRLDTNHRYGRCGPPLVIAVDIAPGLTETSVRAADAKARHINFVAGDVRDPKLPEVVGALLRPGDRPLVVEDTAHNYETTRGALEGFSQFVPDHGFLVVEDTCVDYNQLRVDSRWPRGVVPALTEWLATPAGRAFQVDRTLERYGVTCHPGGFLRRG